MVIKNTASIKSKSQGIKLFNIYSVRYKENYILSSHSIYLLNFQREDLQSQKDLIYQVSINLTPFLGHHYSGNFLLPQILLVYLNLAQMKHPEREKILWFVYFTLIANISVQRIFIGTLKIRQNVRIMAQLYKSASCLYENK